MVKVENKETLRLLTKRFMKMNRARNIIAVIAIMLTSLLFTSLFVGSVSMILSKRATEIKQFMDSSHAIAQNLSEEDAERLQKTIEQSDEVERYGTGIFLGAGRENHFVEETAYQEKQSEQSKMEDQLMEMVGGSESNVWKLYESIMCVYFDMEEIIKQAVYLQGAYDRERMLK